MARDSQAHRNTRSARASARAGARSRGGVVALTVLLLAASVAWVPARHTATQRDGSVATYTPPNPDLQWVLITTAFESAVSYQVHTGGEKGPVKERGYTRWSIDWVVLGILWGCIVLFGAMASLILTDPTASDRPDR